MSSKRGSAGGGAAKKHKPAAGCGDIKGFFNKPAAPAHSRGELAASVPFSQPDDGEEAPEARKRGRPDNDGPISPPEDANTRCSVASAPPEDTRKHRRCRPRDKSFKCTVHGQIDLHPTLWKIIDTPQYQRLRRCKQLGHASLVFQNATHSRFEHSVGVAYKAGKVVKRIQEKQPGLNVTAKDKLCVEIAALVHDLGHGPFSHQFELVLKDFAKELKTKADATDEDRRKAAILDHWEHEEQSWKMLDHLLTVNDIDLSLEENGGLDEKDRIFIKELINGYPLGFKPSEKDNPRYEWGNPPPPYKGRGSDKIFLYEIVSNKRTGLDVDRLDYLQRDVQAALGQYSKTFERLSECVAVCTDQRGNLVLAYPEDEVQSVMETYTTRMSMYNKVYMHRKTLIMDEMVKDILMAAKDSIKIPIRDRKTGEKLAEKSIMDIICEDNFEAFSQLDDSILDLIRLSNSNSDGMKKASVLMDRIQHRDLYVMAGNLCIQDRHSPSCEESHPGKSCKNAACCVSKHHAMWNLKDFEHQVRCDIVQHVPQPQKHTPPHSNDEEVVHETDDEADHDADGNPTLSQIALMEKEQMRLESKAAHKSESLELKPSDLRVKRFTVATGGGGFDKFADPVTKVWFYPNDASEFDAFEIGRTKAIRVSPEHYKVSMPALFCVRELKVLCVDPSKARLAEQAVNGYCADMQMPKAINQSSQLVESPVGVMRLSDINCSTDFYEGLPPDECSQFSQCC